SGLDRVAGLESYIAIPIFRSISLERYLRGGIAIAPRLVQQAAMIFAQVLQDSMKTISGPPGTDALPVVFERNLAPLATALFEGARSSPNWQNVLAVHRVATLLGRYWGHICDALGRLGDNRAVQPMIQLVERSVSVVIRAARPKRRDNLPVGDPDIPGSIVYAAVIRALGQLNDRNTLDFIIRAANDFDP